MAAIALKVSSVTTPQESVVGASPNKFHTCFETESKTKNVISEQSKL